MRYLTLAFALLFPTSLFAQQAEVDVLKECIEQSIVETAYSGSTGYTAFVACQDEFSPTYLANLEFPVRMGALANMLSVYSTQLLDRLEHSSAEGGKAMAADLRVAMRDEFESCTTIRGSRPSNNPEMTEAKCRLDSEVWFWFYILDRFAKEYVELP